MYRTITECNDSNIAPLSNENMRDAINRVIVEEEANSHNVTMDNFSQTPVMPNTQGENENTTLTSEKKNKQDALAETLKGLKTNDAGYYGSDSANANEARGNPASDQKLATHTSDGKKRKFMDTSNGYFQQKLLSNRTLPIITMTIGPRIDDMVATSGAYPL